MMDIDDADRLLREAFVLAADGDVAPSGPAQRVARRVRQRRRRRSALHVSAVGAVCMMIIAAVALSGRVSTHRVPATRPATPSVLLTPQVASDLAARRFFADRSNFESNIEWSSVRLLAQNGSTRLFGARNTHGELCVVLLSAAGASTNCGPYANSPAAKSSFEKSFASHGADIEANTSAGEKNAFGIFVPDSVKSAALDGVPIPIARNGLLLVFTTTKMPSALTLTSETGTETISFSRNSDGGASFARSGAFG